MNTERGAPKARKETVYEVDSFWLDDAVKAEYGQDLDFVAAIECGNDTNHRFIVNGTVSDPNEFQKFVDGDEPSSFGTPDDAMNDMCRKGLLEPVIYIVNVCW